MFVGKNNTVQMISTQKDSRPDLRTVQRYKLEFDGKLEGYITGLLAVG